MNDSAIQKRGERALSELVGTYRSAEDANDRLAWAMANAHLISPATSVGRLPDGVGLMLSVVAIDIRGDTYTTKSGKLGLGKATLERMGQAAGISWNPVLSGRIDDCSHPHYVRWRAVAQVKSFDGFQEQYLCKEKEVDLRDGSDAAKNMTDKELAQQRQHIQSICETKAQLRTIRQLGIKAGYAADELQKPFIAARCQFTGESDDPAIRRMFAERTADAFLGSQNMLYGGAPAAALPALPAVAPPPVGTVPDDDDDDDPPGEQSQGPAPTREYAPTAEKPPPRSADSSGYTIPGGRAKGTPIEKANEQDLRYWAGRFEKGLEDGSSHNQQRDQSMLAAFEAELARR